MSEEELERIRRRKLAQWRNRLMAEKSRKEQIDSKQELLNRVFVGRAWEVFHAAQRQYPQVAKWLGDVIAQLVSAGKIQRVTGGELNYLLRRMGV
ncbi:hypothetical protein GWN63_02360, partial [Candidatus Bathyarchaeota archaeon]|nr:hypothetical protein [Candidatus Bathyarchaeota archaeon]NIU81076.1 hypothetical protein [Candidatus Bathyarchaeota archaeon]NIV68154.1 hypothetical protein [Candidatus Bathyarchaeota archaeon]NIW16527.1 hypothetical protein [Candidatus Bathyarchaeota archaeon]NIW34669.1 hypothetical protein [Candidatus Bathyarchaeota archaeon]